MCKGIPLLLFGIALLVLVGVDAANTIGSQAFIFQMTIIKAAFILYTLLEIPISIGFLSLSYRHFFERR